jgi:photosystem II stability/assembly factor-like uncharacterized protein
LVISPDYNRDHTLYAGVSSKGIYKTIDAGKTWKCIYQDSGQNILLAISPHYTDDGIVLATTSQGLMETNNRGKEWNKVQIDNIGHNILYQAIAISQSRHESKIIIVSLTRLWPIRLLMGGQ